MIVSIAEYARSKGLAIVTVRQKCVRGNLPSAKKIAGRWVVNSAEPYIDARFKTGKYAKKNKQH